MPLLQVAAAIVCAWCMLRVIGAERQRRLEEMKRELARAAAAQAGGEAGAAPDNSKAGH